MAERSAGEPFQVDDVPWEDWAEGSRFGGRTRRLGAFGGGNQVGVNLEELSPGKRSCPSHYHLREEEHLLVLAGSATLRMGDAEHVVNAGDYVCFPAGAKTGHCLFNHTNEVFRYLMIGTSDPTDVVVYPDTGRVGVRLTGAGYDGNNIIPYWRGIETE